MNNSWPALPSWIGPSLWTIAWQSTLWLAVGLVAGRFLRRRAAQAHGALVLAAAASVIAPALTLAVRHLDWGLIAPSASAAAAAPQFVGGPTDGPLFVAPRGPEAARAIADRASSAAAIADRGLAAAPAVRLALPSAASLERLSIALLAVWIACSLWLSLRLAASVRTGRRLVRLASIETHPGLLAALGDAARALGIRSRPVLRVSSAVRCPMIWCWGRQPVLLAPRSAARQDKVSWPGIFCHELAHWLRRDHWSMLCAELAVILLPWNALAWRVRRRSALFREQACDDWVLASGDQAADYAESLVNLVPQCGPSFGLSVLGSRESLKHRLEHLFSDVRVIPRVGRAQIAVTIAVALAAVVGVALAQPGPRPDEFTAQSAAGAVANGPSAPSGDAGDVCRMSGRVVRPDGKPVGGAQLFFLRSAPEKVFEKGTTKSDGTFAFSVPRDAAFGARSLRIIAVKPGFGPGWVDPEDLTKTSEFTLRLADDDLPIEGRLVNLEGRPVVGATVRVAEIQTFAGDDFHPYVKLLKTDEMRASNYHFASWLFDVPQSPSARTDSQGNFRLIGVGRHRQADLVIAGEAIADTRIDILTEPLEGLLNAGQKTGFTHPVYGVRFVHHVGPSRPIIGTVTDAKTGRPIEGVRVSQFDGFSRAITDASGRFELPGCAKGAEYRLCAVPTQAKSVYFSGSIAARDTPGLGPLSVELHVYPAIPLTGRVLDTVTGKPVSAEVSYWPLYHNRFIVKGMNATAIRATGPFNQSFTKSDGTFSLGVLPGPGALVVRLPGKSDFEPAHVDADAFFEREGVPYGHSEWKGQVKFDFLVIAVGTNNFAPMPQSQFQGIALLNVSDDGKPLTQDIGVRSKAANRRASSAGPRAKPAE